MQQQHRQQQRLKTLVLALAAAFPVVVAANPLDPTVAAGHATFATSGSTLSITNAPGTVIDWRSFSIGNGEVTRFIQQNAASQVLNRVTGADPSSILGTLQSNGQVFLINPNGIVFGANARVDVAGLVASTLGISNDNFLAGRLTFGAQAGAGNIRNDGQLQALGGGSIFLIAPTVENHGIVRAPDGAVVLAAGKQATLVDTYRPDVRVEISAPGDAAINVGQLIGGNVGIYAGAIRNEGTVSATGAAVNANGTIVFRASTSIINDATGSIAADGRVGGAISIEGLAVSLGGTITAGGASGGSIQVNADRITQSGTIAANGTTGAGGRVSLRGAGGIAQTLSARTMATGTIGGAVELRTGDAGRLYSSGTIDVSGSSQAGGTAHLIAGDIALAGATLLANGPAGGGSILVGGGARGQDPALPNSRTVYASVGTTVRADGLTSGNGGEIVFWSEGATRVGATLSARGGAIAGNGGSIEVSGRESTAFGGTASAAAPHGVGGTFLLDPKNIIIDDVVGGISYRDLLDPNPNTDGVAGNGYGSTIEFYNGTAPGTGTYANTLVTDPYDNAMGARSGAMYLYRGSDGALLTTLTGAAANDGIGQGQRFTSGGYLLLMHSAFGSADGSLANAMGAVTWLNPGTGLLSNGASSGVVSSANSLVGTNIGDRVGRTSDVFPAAFSVGASKIVIASPHWNADRGAMTWLDVTTGRLADGTAGGAISTANSLVGSNAGDGVGTSVAGQPITPEPGSAGGIFVISERWNGTRGAVTWMDGNTGRLSDGTTGGAVSSSNSLVGENAQDRVGYGRTDIFYPYPYRPSIKALGNGILFFSPYYGSGGTAENAKGAVTWINASNGKLTNGSAGGIIGAGNSLVGANAGDRVGVNASSLEGDIQTSGSTALIYSSSFGRTFGEGTAHQGAVTWIDGANGRLADGRDGGIVNADNSFVGGNRGDGFANATGRSLVGNRVMLQSPDWNIGRGAITWINIVTGRTPDGARSGAIGATNSIVGGAPGDRVGSTVTRLASGNYVILAPFLDDIVNGNADAGAAAWMSSAGVLLDGNTTGTINVANALIGAGAFDRTGTSITLADSGNRNFVISTPTWNGGAGAVTWINGTTGNFANGSKAVGIVGTTNSVYGSTAGDAVGSDIRRLSNGNILLVSPHWTNVGIDGNGADAGAVTWISGTTGLLASMANSAAFDGVANAVGVRNSLVGHAPGALVGSGGIIDDFGYVIVKSPSASGSTQTGTWSGAVTWMSTSTGQLSNMASGVDYLELGGRLASANSLLDVGTPSDTRTGFGSRFFLNAAWNGGRGSLTWMGSNGRLTDGTTGGFVSDVNSVVGSSIVEGAALSVQSLSGTNNFVLLNPLWGSGGDTPDAGAVTWISGQTGRLANGAAGGTVSGLNSIVGTRAGDRIGSDGVQRLHTYDATGFIVRSSHRQFDSGDGFFEDAGAITWFNGNNGLLAGMTTAADFAQQGGFVWAGNSLVGHNRDDRIGGSSTSITEIGYYFTSQHPVFIRHGDYNDGQGAITWMAAATGQLSDGTFRGQISNANSLRGNTDGDTIGSGGIQQVNGNDYLRYLVLSPNWSDGPAKAGAGAVTWIDGATGRLSNGTTGGRVSAANSLVGSTAGDRVGSGGVQMVSTDYNETRYLISSPEWNRGGTQAAAGAVTWINTTTGTLINDTSGGVLSESNSLVGSSAGERLGDFGTLNLGSGKYLLSNPLWSDGGTKANAGALTWFDGQNGTLATGASLRGVVSVRNSVVGKSAGEQIGSGNIITWLTGDGVLAFSPEWSDAGAKPGAGAVTWIHRDTGRLANMVSGDDYATVGGGVDGTNSLVGAAANARAGGDTVNQYDYRRYQDLGNGRVLLMTRNHGDGRGAITWMNMESGRLSDGSAGGAISATNSLVGDRTTDDVANNANLLDSGSSVFVINPGWHSNTGAVTWIDRDTGRLIDGSTGGVVSAANSLVGSASGDRIGEHYCWSYYCDTSYNRLFSENFVFWSHTWNASRGAVTWIGGNGLLAGMTDATNFDGTVGSGNSLVGTIGTEGGGSGDRIGLNGVTFREGSNEDSYYVIQSSGWNDGRGAITRIDATTGRLIDGSTGGTPGVDNSLVGVSAGDAIGGSVAQSVSGGNYLVHSTTFGSNSGAVTLMDRDWSVIGLVSRDNSVIGNQANAGLQANNFSSNSFQQDFANGTSLIRFATDGAGRIAVLSNTLSVAGPTPPIASDYLPGSTITVSPATIAAMLNDGTRVTLEATNDIIVRKAIVATGTTDSTGALELRAGRHITLNASITNLNQDDSGLSFLAHANDANLVDSTTVTDGGAGAITAAPGVVITTSGGVELRAASIGTASSPIAISSPSSAKITARATAGDVYLRHLGDVTRFSMMSLRADPPPSPSNPRRRIRVESVDGGFLMDGDLDAKAALLELVAPAPAPSSVAGRVKLSSGGTTFTGGPITIGGESELTLQGDAFSYTGTTIVTTGGALVLAAASSTIGSVQVQGGSMSVDGALVTTNLNQSGGSVGGRGDLTITNTFTKTGGTLGQTFRSIDVTQAAGDLDITDLGATDNLTLRATTGTLTITNAISQGGTVTLDGANGLVIRSSVVGAGDVLLKSGGAVNVSGVSVQSTGGILAVNAGSLSIDGTGGQAHVGGNGGTILAVSGPVTIRGGSTAGSNGASAMLGSANGLCVGAIEGDLTLTGGAAASASAMLFGGPDIGVRSTDNSGALQVGGVITMTSGSGEGSYARIHAASPSTIFVNFPTRTGDGFTVDGQAVTAVGQSGFFANGVPAVRDQNLFITYGRLDSISSTSPNNLINPILADIENASRNRWLAKVEDNSQPILPQCR